MQFSVIAHSTLATDSTLARKFQTFHDQSILSFARHRPLPDRNMALKIMALPLHGLSHQLYHFLRHHKRTISRSEGFGRIE